MLREELDPNYDRFDDIQCLKGTGNGTLPENDSHPVLDPPYERGTLIRVYLFVNQDHVRDRLSLFTDHINEDKIDVREIVTFPDRADAG